MIVNLPTNKDVLLVHAGDDPGIIINRDLINPVYFGNHSAFVIPGESSIIDALTFVQYSGDVDIWAHSGAAGFIQVDVQPNCENWSPSPAQSAASIAASGIMLDATGQSLIGTVNNPSYGPITTANPGLLALDTIRTAIPANISTTGAPGLALSQLLLSTGNTVIGAGATYTSSLINFNQLGYNIRLSLVENVAGTAGNVCSVTMTWLDSGSGLTVYQEIWHIVPGAPSNPHIIGGAGPSKGNQLQISIQNRDTQAVTFNMQILMNSRTYGKDDWRTISTGTFTGYTSTAFDMFAQTVADSMPNVGAGASLNRMLPLYSGEITMHVRPASTALYIVYSLNPLATAFQQVVGIDATSGKSTMIEASLPQAQCYLFIQNTGASAANCGAEITARDVI